MLERTACPKLQFAVKKLSSVVSIYFCTQFMINGSTVVLKRKCGMRHHCFNLLVNAQRCVKSTISGEFEKYTVAMKRQRPPYYVPIGTRRKNGCKQEDIFVSVDMTLLNA